MAFDAQSGMSDQNSGQKARQQLDTNLCGGGIDWSRGLKGLPRVSREFTDVSSSLLTKVIEGEIIPRLLLAHREMRRAEPLEQGLDDLVTSEALARLVLFHEADEIVDYLQILLDRGITLECLFLDVLAPVARKLGELWEEDQCTFTDVTLALSRLHSVLHTMGGRGNAALRPALERRAFFAPVPGEKHTFGISILEEFFLHAGWETACDHNPSAAGIMQLAATQSLDIIGFSVGCQELLDPLSDLIGKIRKVSCNRSVTIMVGGGLFIDNRDLAARFGNATIVSDCVHAVQAAEEIVSRIRHKGEARKIG
jgi:methanogenic corrinoid protein MtbC1